jgi:hypothetical protein
MLAAGVSELRSAFNRLLAKSTADSESDYLLLFYAVECGLKALILHRARLRSTDQISDPQIKGTHDLSRLAKELRMPASVAGACASFRTQRDSLSYDIGHAHQAWRYGIRIAGPDEQLLVAWLRALATWIKGAK